MEVQIYLVTYDLRKPQRNYNALYERLRQDFKAKRVLESVWLISTIGGIDFLFDQIRDVLDGNDGLFIVEVSKGPARSQNTELDT